MYLLYILLFFITIVYATWYDLSSSSLTLLSGLLTIISVNVVFIFYICLAMREPSQKYEPDPFFSDANASVKQFKSDESGNIWFYSIPTGTRTLNRLLVTIQSSSRQAECWIWLLITCNHFLSSFLYILIRILYLK